MPTESRRPRACLVVLYGAELGKRYALGRATFEIGRSSKCELSLNSDAVSRTHARIHWDKVADAHAVKDLGSTNGTWVNDTRVEASELADGDQLKVGRTLFKYMSGDDIDAHYNEEIYRIMTVDGLTRAYNERYFLEALERECKRSHRHERDLALVLFGIDGFAEVVARHGDVAGDGLLRFVAGAVLPKLRREDVMARLGNERFGVLLPEVGRDGARVTAEKIRELVRRTTFIIDDAPVACSVTAAAAVFDRAKPAAGDLLAAARAAFKQVKAAGRQR